MVIITCSAYELLKKLNGHRTTRNTFESYRLYIYIIYYNISTNKIEPFLSSQPTVHSTKLTNLKQKAIAPSSKKKLKHITTDSTQAQH